GRRRRGHRRLRRALDMAVLVATIDGYHVLTSAGEHHVALGGHEVEALTPGPRGTWIAVVDRHEIWQHGDDGEWRPLASTDFDLTCLVTVGDVVFAGAVGAHVLRLDDDGALQSLAGFDAAPSRDEWYPVGSALEVRSVSATADQQSLFANVHVGGIVRSDDGGHSWRATIDVDADVHEVKAHPTSSEIVMAAAAVGLCVSRDGGRRFEVVDRGLHATYARAIAFDGDDVLVSVSDGPFTRRSAIYRGPVDGVGIDETGLELVRDGLPEWLDGNVDTRCLAAGAGRLALADGSGALWVTAAGERRWSLAADRLSRVTAVVVV
ncbi:MAG: hypothetical protein QOF28_2399, partial [Actinomycetota bacterium]|nr:hypothetical protein [Actinomycetota bacterium]